MIETLVPLLFAHMVGDFLMQPGVMIRRKREPLMLLAHVATHVLLAALALGTVPIFALLILGGTHLAIDALKLRFGGGWRGFALDQVAHLAVIGGLALVLPGLWSWPVPEALPVMAVAAGLIAALQMGRFGIGAFMDDLIAGDTEWEGPALGLKDGGTYIGLAERLLIFVLVLQTQFAAIGFLIAAKSVLRFEATHDKRQAEYVIVGTLVSFAWAILVGLATQGLLERLAA
ncbi:DUF3307 domain-containing protein [Pontivivens ytuae]|uniref:DUF3307 domain-containing protein n=1 Tax=Pontivivens ytuae TaxID=2789856 RepID=A0A7S9QDD3_9RHOB|nr:DUF3307 domain-containing protein [Pontivivens ytuae]QPH54770.1 DUF3307 domain-containing protein [Pontivivens ytuae]